MARTGELFKEVYAVIKTYLEMVSKAETEDFCGVKNGSEHKDTYFGKKSTRSCEE